jgi:hypothetical protein
VLTRLTASNASVTWINQIRTVVALDRADERRAFGESLPAGLRLMAAQIATDRVSGQLRRAWPASS